MSRPPHPAQLPEILYGRVMGWVILVISVIITVLAWHTADVYQEKRAQERFDFRVEEAKWSILKRMREYEQVLRGGVGLFNASDEVTRKDWHRYVTTLKLDTYWPGIQGIGFSYQFASENKQALIDAIRAQGFEQFDVHPRGEREQYGSIIFLEPFVGRNLRAFGYDMWSEPVRRAAMQQARDTGEAAFSGKVTLVQETDQDVQAGVLLYLPVYREGMETGSVEERHRALLGFVYSPFRMRDLMEGILGLGVPDLDFDLYDGGVVAPEQQLHTTHPDRVVKPDSRYVRESCLELPGGRIWLARFTSRPEFEVELESRQPLIIALLGMLVDLLLFVNVLALSGQKERVQRKAGEIASALNQAERRYRQMVENVKDIIFQTDAEGRWSFLNAAWVEVSGFSVQESLGQSFLQYVHPDDKARAHDQFAKMMRGELHYLQDEYRGVHRQGEMVWVDVYLSVLTDERGVPIGSSGVLRDVTMRKQVEMVMLRARDAAESANRAKSEFLANMSHELRSPLNSLLILSKLLSRDGNLTPEQLESVRVIHESGRDLLNMINDILDLSKIEAGRMELVPEEIYLDRFARELLDPFRAFATSKGLGLTHELIGDLPEIFVADGGKLKQILSNFLSNALKFTESGGVLLRIRRVAGSANGEKGVVLLFQVEDSGIGIPGDKLEMIFESFRQVDGAMSRKYGGTGLGLSIARKLAELLDARIEVHSREGQGSLFTLVLKEMERSVLALNPDSWEESAGLLSPSGVGVEVGEALIPEPEDLSQPEPLRIHGHPVTVLVVDDDMRMAFSIASGLQKRVEHVLLAANGVRALRELEKHPEVHAMVLDIRMPEMDGLETMRLLRADPRQAHLAILVLTAQATLEDEARCLEAGADAYLAKPASMEAIWRKLEACLKNRAEDRSGVPCRD
ncbi:MAG: CHASE domain-containing protein [Magnetococcales bacterium]|nr:CHASE domain-containing protein [Magnetococcales bacterium]